ncbi:hypothetical protein [Pseudomonas sp. MWU12-2037]|uniref:thioesterase family protein n=1 Tax=Pseudomonas sp. MWU12-2037 TaxID=2928690 RepID=UPI00200F1ED4|nr:hypothetical protein [Pseudomonas sp. MWU12-2037]
MLDALGSSAVLEHTVTPADLASHWRNEMPVLATPILLWLAELVAMKAIEGLMPSSRITLGVAHDSRHLAPTLEGATVSVCATLSSVKGHYLEFSVQASDGLEMIFSGTHTRAIVDRQAFMARIAAKSPGVRA